MRLLEENLGTVQENSEHDEEPADQFRKTRIQGSISYVPGIMGLTAAGLVINDILNPGPAQG